MPDPDVMAELTATMRPDWTCLWRAGHERCEGHVTHYVHLHCEYSKHKGQGSICAGHLKQISEGHAYDTTVYPGHINGPCLDRLIVRLLIPIDNIDWRNFEFLKTPE